MNDFEAVLQRLKADHTELFESDALREPTEEELAVDIHDFDVPDRREIERREQIGRPPDLPFDQEQDGDWWDLDHEGDDFDHDSRRAREEHEGFESRPRRAGVELLAVYLPFHLYPTGHWGVRFFERPMARFTDRLHPATLRQRLAFTWGEVLKVATYGVARHEFVHYLVELEALDLELKMGRRVYLPYWNGVYKRVFAGPDCLEETVANVWSWDNNGRKATKETRPDLYRGAFADTASRLRAGRRPEPRLGADGRRPARCTDIPNKRYPKGVTSRLGKHPASICAAVDALRKCSVHDEPIARWSARRNPQNAATEKNHSHLPPVERDKIEMLSSQITQGLVICMPWIEYILSGGEAWEMRTKSANLRGRTALIRKARALGTGSRRLSTSKDR
jgi:hypothetical protein